MATVLQRMNDTGDSTGRPTFRVLPGGVSPARREDEALVAAFLVGDEVAFGELVRRHEQTVLRIVRRWARSPDDAHDLAQRTFLRAFEATRIAPAEFHHREHIRAAWAALCHYPLDEALRRYRAALQRLAARAGKPGIFHETITWAYLLLIHERLVSYRPPGSAGDSLQFADFAARHPDLLTWRPSILDAYYSKEVLGSERARQVFILPRAPAAASAVR